MKDHIVLRLVSRILMPFIFLYGLYIQFHGEYSPGGGFQAGIICAAALIVYALIYNLDNLIKFFPLNRIQQGAAFGVLLYGGVGVVTLLMGGNFLDYSALAAEPTFGQKTGIIIIELGVGITVFSVIMLIFTLFAQRSR